MAQRAANWDVAPEGGSTASSDFRSPVVDWPTILPVNKPRAIRRVGTVQTLAPRKNLGVIIDDTDAKDALFSLDDVDPSDRGKLANGLSVTYIAVIGPDGVTAKQIQIDRTTLPPPPPELFLSKGWR